MLRRFSSSESAEREELEKLKSRYTFFKGSQPTEIEEHFCWLVRFVVKYTCLTCVCLTGQTIQGIERNIPGRRHNDKEQKRVGRETRPTGIPLQQSKESFKRKTRK